jgi:hypothetical protein
MSTILTTDFNVGSQYISFDGENLLISRVDGTLWLDFLNNKHYGMGYIPDPYRESLEDTSDEAIGFIMFTYIFVFLLLILE